MLSEARVALAALGLAVGCIGASGSVAATGTPGTFTAPTAKLAYTAYGRRPTVVVLAGGPGLNAA